MRGMSPASLMLPALLACFGPPVSAQVLPPGSCPLPDPLDYTVRLPHPTDCSKFFSCSNGVPIEMNCTAGLYFNDELKVCDWPQNANCVRGRFPLQNDVGGTWTPSSCTAGPNKQDASCKLQCNEGYQLRGSSFVLCTDKGWDSVNGGFVPKSVECINGDMDNDLNKTPSGKAGILFVLDESGSMGQANFERLKVFVKDVVQKYPLSQDRFAGVITFDSTARVPIRLNVDSTSDFLNAVDRIGYSGGGGSSFLAALQAAVNEINNYSKHDLTVVVLITGAESSTDGTPAANTIKEAGNPLFAIGINANNNLVHLESLASTGENGIKHFFHVTSYELLENIGKYLNPPAGPDVSTDNPKCTN